MRNLGALGSSADPTKLSTTISGIFVGGAVILVMLAKWLGFEITTNEVTDLGIQVGSMVATLMTLYGIIKKVAIALQNKFKGVQ